MSRKSLCFLVVISNLLITLMMVGCATTAPSAMKAANQPSQYAGRVDDPKVSVSVFDRMRYANQWQQQDYRKGKSITYHKIHGHMSLLSSLSQDQKDIQVLQGPPEYVRSFSDFEGHRIDEWIYKTKNIQIQFQNGTLAYCGEVSDQAKLVIVYGQPTKIFSNLLMGGNQKSDFWYRKPFRIITVNDGKLVVNQ
jgi:hypothetical protein